MKYEMHDEHKKIWVHSHKANIENHDGRKNYN